MSVRGYKVFKPDWTCRGFQYEVGKTYKHDGDIEMCKAGFHFCQKISDCFNYYTFDINNKVAEVEAIGNVETNGDKSVTDKIVILRELTWYEVLDLTDTGKYCMGYNNSGDYNKGKCNRGFYNIGSFNQGSANTGNWNNGNYNNGYKNSGNFNQGDHNTGDWNLTNWSTGFFNTVEHPVYIFNKPSNITIKDFNNLKAVNAMKMCYRNNVWISSTDMSEKEKIDHPEYKIIGGYYKVIDFKTGCSLMWDEMTEEEKASVKDIPNFDAKIFEEITGIIVD